MEFERRERVVRFWRWVRGVREERVVKLLPERVREVRFGVGRGQGR